jgi:hypothetical protein
MELVVLEMQELANSKIRRKEIIKLRTEILKNRKNNANN